MQKSIIVLIVVLLLGLAASPVAQAQTSATVIESLQIDFWPDYDHPSVLVLLTGTLTSDTPFPATVTVPMPAGATLNAVARITTDGSMLADIDYDDTVTGSVTLTINSPTFRVEYYAPYEVTDDLHSFSFTWREDVTVNQLEATIQQPASTTALDLEPAAVEVIAGQDGLQYHRFPPQVVPAGESYTLSFSYVKVLPQLSVDVISSPDTALPAGTVAETAASGEDDFNWPLVIGAGGGVLLAAVTLWFTLSRRSTGRRPLKPRPVRQPGRRPAKRSVARPGSGGTVRFCHECGQPVEEGDRFCGNCGTALKTG